MKKFLKKHIIVPVILLVLVLIAVAGGGYYYQQYQKTKQLLDNPTLAAQQEVNALLTKVGRLIELPTDEQPTVATVSDVNKLKDQQFFNKAKNGDKVIIYTRAKKAILYDPNLDKVVEVAPVNIGEPSPQVTRQQLPVIKIAILNGTTVSGLSTTTEDQLKAKVNNITVVSKGNAKGSDYKQTIVVDLTGGKQTTAVSQLATLLKGTVGKLPEGETKPTGADILIILGQTK